MDEKDLQQQLDKVSKVNRSLLIWSAIKTFLIAVLLVIFYTRGERLSDVEGTVKSLGENVLAPHELIREVKTQLDKRSPDDVYSKLEIIETKLMLLINESSHGL